MTTYALVESATVMIDGASQGVASNPDGLRRWVFDGDEAAGRAPRIVEIDQESGAVIKEEVPFLVTSGVNQLGAGCYFDARLFVPAFDAANPTASGQLLFFELDSLTAEESFDISAQGFEPSALAVDEARGFIWIASRGDASRLWIYSLSDFSFLGTRTLVDGIPFARGIAVHPADGSLWVASGGPAGEVPPGEPREIAIYRVTPETGEVLLVLQNTANTEWTGGLAFAEQDLIWSGYDALVRYTIEVTEEPPPPPPPEPPPPPVPYTPDPRANAYARQLQQLLPPGRLWKLESGSWLARLLLGVADELARVDACAEDLLREWDPRTAVETLADWERVLGIMPGPTATVSERQNAAATKLVARGGQTIAYLVALAARLGFVATITPTAPGAWRMDVDLGASSAGFALRVSEFRAGSSRAGDRIANRSVAELEAEINRAKPAHRTLLFAYSA